MPVDFIPGIGFSAVSIADQEIAPYDEFESKQSKTDEEVIDLRPGYWASVDQYNNPVSI